jgi:hypothetical protein
MGTRLTMMEISNTKSCYLNQERKSSIKMITIKVQRNSARALSIQDKDLKLLLEAQITLH